ncbi:MAG: hypothetical protein KUG78_08495 [Kangiellaceae bacterium]|nr:hypothetical protein [Kangiellaceae bacterium]
MRHPTRAAIDKFNQMFKLHEDPRMQDWEIECADPERVEEFINGYDNEPLDDDDRFTLMALILGSFEEYHGLEQPDVHVWGRIKKRLVEHQLIHKTHIEYYQCLDATDEEEFFPITKLMREIEL